MDVSKWLKGIYTIPLENIRRNSYKIKIINILNIKKVL